MLIALRCCYKTSNALKRLPCDDDISDWLATVVPRRGHGSTKVVVSSGGEGPQGLGPGKTNPTDRYHGRRIRIRVERHGPPESLPSISVSQGESSPMLKPLTMSLSLAVALGLCSASKAGGYDQNCSTCGLASPQGAVASAQEPGYGHCEPQCAPRRCWSFHLPKLNCHLPRLHHEVCYEWVLQKKHKWSFQHYNECDHGHGCAAGYGGGAVHPTGQAVAAPSGQGLAAPSGQASGQVFGAGQHVFQAVKPSTSIASVPAEMTPAVPGGEEAPPAPEVRETSAIGSQNGGLLLPTPSAN